MSLGNFIFNDDFQKKRKGERSAGWVSVKIVNLKFLQPRVPERACTEHQA